MSLARLRAVLVLALLSAYLIAEHGFMLVRIPPTGQYGVPLAELTILSFVATFPWDYRRIRSFASVAPLAPLILWWGLGFIRTGVGFYDHGIWAIRDASNLIDSLFIWIGFVVAASPGFMITYSRWLRVTCNVAIGYGLLFPFREQLAAWAPSIPAPGGYVSPLLFNYAAGPQMVLMGAARLLLDRVRVFGLSPAITCGLLIAFSVAIYQARTTYLQVLALLVLLAYLKPRAAYQMTGGLVFGLAALVVLLQVGLDVKGRLGQEFSLEFLAKHFSAIWATDATGAVTGSVEGTFQRLKWWKQIWHDVTSDATPLSFGLGYGIPLTSFRYHNDALVREPHNSTISVFARLGVVGLFAYLWLLIALARTWLRVIKRLTEIGDEVWQVNIAIMGCSIVFVLVLTLGEDGLEKPFNAIPFYFFWGVILRVAYALNVHTSEAMVRSVRGRADTSRLAHVQSTV